LSTSPGLWPLVEKALSYIVRVTSEAFRVHRQVASTYSATANGIRNASTRLERRITNTVANCSRLDNDEPGTVDGWIPRHYRMLQPVSDVQRPSVSTAISRK